MNNNKDEYKRLSHIMELLLSDRFSQGVSVRVISLNLNVPIEVAAQDMYAITGNKYIRDCLELSDGTDTDIWRAELKKGLSGAIETPVRITADMFVPEDAGDVVALSLSPFEKNVFAEVTGDPLAYDQVWIKEPAFAKKRRAAEVPGTLQIAAQEGNPVTFSYTEGGKTLITERFIPCSIYTDPFEKNVYLAGMHEGKRPVLKRIDFIKDIKVHYDENVMRPENTGLAFLDYLWGTDIEPGEMPEEVSAGLKPDEHSVTDGCEVRAVERKRSEADEHSVTNGCEVREFECKRPEAVGQPEGYRIVDGYAVRHVKLKIYKETGNLYEKIRTETNGRRFGRLYDDPTKDDVAYYEDEVCGMGSFKSWLLGYGASVYVLEPKELAREMYDIAVRRLERYEEGEW